MTPKPSEPESQCSDFALAAVREAYEAAGSITEMEFNMEQATTPDLAAKLRAVWASGDYPAVADEVIPTLGAALVKASGVSLGDRVLDIGAGSGNAAIPAAETGAEVVASDITPELLEHGRQIAEARGLAMTWEVADAQELPYADASFDAALSCVGIMFAPYHQASADEMLRVLRPGGRIALANWTPEGFIGQLFAAMKPYAPRPPMGAQPPPLWGDERHVTELFGTGVSELTLTRQLLPVDRFADGEAFRDFFKTKYGPTIGVYKAIADDPAKVAELDAALAGLAAKHQAADGSMAWEYLLVTARRA